jgi:hypothetical protein
MKKQSYFIFSLLISACLAACSKDPVTERKVFYMDQEFRDHSFFKPGTWWVYKKDTLTQDSISVISSNFLLVEPDSVDYSWQRSNVVYQSSFYNDTTTLSGDFIHSSSMFFLKETKGNEEALNFFSLKPPGFVLNLSPSLQMRYRELKDTTLNGQPFGAVRIFENLVAPSDSTLPKELWFVKNTGIIRKELWNGEVWYLDRYHVIQ